MKKIISYKQTKTDKFGISKWSSMKGKKIIVQITKKTNLEKNKAVFLYWFDTEKGIMSKTKVRSHLFFVIFKIEQQNR